MGNGDFETTCVVCGDSGGDVRLVCKHVFHAGCVEAWCARSATCPLCRGRSAADASDPATRRAIAARLRDVIARLGDLRRELIAADREYAGLVGIADGGGAAAV